LKGHRTPTPFPASPHIYCYPVTSTDYKVLKQVHPDTGILSKAMDIIKMRQEDYHKQPRDPDRHQAASARSTSETRSEGTKAVTTRTQRPRSEFRNCITWRQLATAPV